MVNSKAIRIENLCKRYLIEHQPGSQGHKRYTALRDVVGAEVGKVARRALKAARGHPVFQTRDVEEFWALKNVNFEVEQGEAVGVIGRNGAGKSTLLKILSRITDPTEGRVELHGRVASLLEVGTGFHPELTGRENIFLNGAILGMTRREIRARFDEIVAFAAVEKFLDTPVKRYSSGMYVRLAFAVAAHLEPEILIVDEVLAVGDAEFQQKCLQKMSDDIRDSRTILFVSHNMDAIRTLTKKCILLDQGQIAASGATQSIIEKYLSSSLDNQARLRCTDLKMFRRGQFEDCEARMTGIELRAAGDHASTVPQVPFGSKLVFDIHLDVYRTMRAADFGLVINNSRGQKITELARSDYAPGLSFEPGKYTLSISVSDLPVSPGHYFVDAWLLPKLGMDAACDAIYDYPLFSIVKEGHVDHYQPPIPWGAVHCQAVRWNVTEKHHLAVVAAGSEQV